MKNSLEQQLSKGRIAISNARANAEIMKLLTKVGYNDAAMLKGLGYLDQVHLQQSVQRDKHSSQLGSTQSFYDEMKETRSHFSRHVKLARIAYAGNREKMSLLLLDKKRSNAVERWLNRASIFYQELLKDSTLIVQYGVPLEELQQMQAMVEALLDKRNQQVSCKGEAQHATQKRNEALKAYKAWMKDFRMAARFALREEPQLLEVLGMLVRTKVE